MAQELSLRPHLVFACGRYEGIDERVYELAAEKFHVRPVSIGDYVLNGGEAAVLVMIEAMVRLIPGVLGNPKSLEEESHNQGLLEYPVYSKPAQYKGAQVPQVLLSGHHEKIAAWRFEQQLIRTKKQRPELFDKVIPEQLTPQQRLLYDKVNNSYKNI